PGQARAAPSTVARHSLEPRVSISRTLSISWYCWAIRLHCAAMSRILHPDVEIMGRLGFASHSSARARSCSRSPVGETHAGHCRLSERDAPGVLKCRPGLERVAPVDSVVQQ